MLSHGGCQAVHNEINFIHFLFYYTDYVFAGGFSERICIYRAAIKPMVLSKLIECDVVIPASRSRLLFCGLFFKGDAQCVCAKGKARHDSRGQSVACGATEDKNIFYRLALAYSLGFHKVNLPSNICGTTLWMGRCTYETSYPGFNDHDFSSSNASLECECSDISGSTNQ